VTARSAPAPEVRVAGVRLTHPDRVLYPAQGITKHDLALFYESIAEFILPHLQGRPLSLVRCPEGTGKGCFYMKHAGTWGVPDALRRVPIQEKSKVGEYLIVDSLPALVGLVQMGILEIHTWNAVYERLERPDRIVFDLDPGPGVSWERVIEAAQTVRKALSTLDLEGFVKTTGGKGLHVVVPLTPVAGWDECFDFSRRFVEAIVASDPGSYTSVMSKARRKEKIFIDYFRNNRGATSVAAYSTRIHPGAPVSTPLTWAELRPSVRSDQYNVLSLPRRLAALSKDPWAAYGKTRQRLPGKRK
jgi:bifunctional non-homologous end joining protein LigD